MQENKRKRILLTGGGTGGHFMPNVALIEHIHSHHPHWETFYIGSKNGMEKNAIEQLKIPYKGISVGKLRRYWSWENFTDLFKVGSGFFQAMKALSEIKPDVVYSKGGYVSVPVILAAHMKKIPIIAHESDVVPGLATKIAAKYAKIVCTTFEQSKKYLPKGVRMKHVGQPVRDDFSRRSTIEGHRITGFEKDIPTLLVMGGSQGAMLINEFIWDNLPELLSHMNIVHIVGKGNLRSIDWNALFLNEKLGETNPHTSKLHPEEHKFQQAMRKQSLSKDQKFLTKRYKQVQFLTHEFPHVMQISDLTLCRSGAGSIVELAKLEKPAILVPLGTNQSRGDQIVNAQVLETKGAAVVLTEQELAHATTESLELIKVLIKNKEKLSVMSRRIKEFYRDDAAEQICYLLESA